MKKDGAKMAIDKKRDWLVIFLWLVALHSFLVGWGLVIFPKPLIGMMGFESCTERFFPTQGGVFHIAMAVGYGLAAWDMRRYGCLALFSIIVKIIATIFLMSYFFFADAIPMVLLSGLSDMAMGLILWWLYATRKDALK
jgi:hypothetical protein